MLPPPLLPPSPSPPPRRINWVKDGNKEEKDIKELQVEILESKIIMPPPSLLPEEEETKEIVGGNLCIHEHILDEMLFEILIRLPAQDILNSAKLVCRKWYNMMRTKNFVHKHVEHASYGLLHRNGFCKDAYFVSARDGGGIETYKMNYECNFKNWRGTWNGLTLEYDGNVNNLFYYVRNVLTLKTLRLPQFPYHEQTCGIGYDATSMRHKVVVTFKKLSGEFDCAILTVGVDESWRTVCTDHLSLVGRRTPIGSPIITEGFMHWNGLLDSTYVMTLNLEYEIIVETPPPIPKTKAITRYYYLSTGRYLSLILRCGRLDWDVLEMNPETRKWSKFGTIFLEGEIEQLGFKHDDDVDIQPCGWLKYPEVLALIIQSHSIVFYNLITLKLVLKGCRRLIP